MSILEYNRSDHLHKCPFTTRYHGPDSPGEKLRSQYTGPDYDYRFNSLAFRGQEIIPGTRSLSSFGCSITVGYGVPEQDRFADVAASKLGLVNHCFAAGGSDSLSIFRNIVAFLRNNQEGLDTRLLVVLWTFISRCSVQKLDARGFPLIKTLVANYMLDDDPRLQNFITDWAELSGELYMTEMMKAVDLICHLANIKCIQLTLEPLTAPTIPIASHYSDITWYKPNMYGMPQLGLADEGRDLHPGIQTHKNIADKILKICIDNGWEI
jgi:hypothetical protein